MSIKVGFQRFSAQPGNFCWVATLGTGDHPSARRFVHLFGGQQFAVPLIARNPARLPYIDIPDAPPSFSAAVARMWFECLTTLWYMSSTGFQPR